MEDAVNRMEDAGDYGLELARHATRGALHAGQEVGEQADRVARAAATGTIRTLSRMPVETLDALRGAGYGTLQGALESGSDPAQVATAVVDAAREVAPELGMSEQDAASAAASGILSAAADAGEETLAAVRRAMPEELAHVDDRGKAMQEGFSE